MYIYEYTTQGKISCNTHPTATAAQTTGPLLAWNTGLTFGPPRRRLSGKGKTLVNEALAYSDSPDLKVLKISRDSLSTTSYLHTT